MRCSGVSALAPSDAPAAKQKEVNTLRMRSQQDPVPAERCLAWNSDLAHQRLAGRARARQFTRDYQTQAGQCSFSAFSARWRAEQGLAPLSVEATERYVTIEDIRGPLGQPLPASARAAIYATWCTGRLVGVAEWLEHHQPAATETSSTEQARA
jgi:hypothetical protein